MYICTHTGSRPIHSLCAYSRLLSVSLAVYHVYLHYARADKLTLSKQKYNKALSLDGDIPLTCTLHVYIELFLPPCCYIACITLCLLFPCLYHAIITVQLLTSWTWRVWRLANSWCWRWLRMNSIVVSF